MFYDLACFRFIYFYSGKRLCSACASSKNSHIVCSPLPPPDYWDFESHVACTRLYSDIFVSSRPVEEEKTHLFELIAQSGHLRMQHLCKKCQCNEMISCLNFCTLGTSRCLWTAWALFDYTSQWWTQQVQGPKTQLYLFRGSVAIVAQHRVIQFLWGIRVVSDVCNGQIFFTSDFFPSALRKLLDVKHRLGHDRPASWVWPL